MLTKQQIQANIEALEKQGAKPNEIQGWLDTLKQPTQSVSQPVQTDKYAGVKELGKDVKGVITGALKGTANVAVGMSSLGEKVVRGLMPKKVEEVFNFPEGKTVAQTLIPEAVRQPENFNEMIGTFIPELSIILTPFRGTLSLPPVLANSPVITKVFETISSPKSTFGKIVSAISKKTTKGALEYGTKSEIVSGGKEGSFSTGAKIGAAAELFGLGLNTLFSKLAPTLDIRATIPTPQTKPPRYVPQPQINPSLTPLPPAYQAKGITADKLMTKYKVPNTTVGDAYLNTSDKLKIIGSSIDDVAKSHQELVDIKPVLNNLDNYIKNQKKIGMIKKAEFAIKIKTSLEYSSPSVLNSGQMSVKEAVDWRRLYDSAKFEDPAVAELAKEVYKIAGDGFREIVNSFDDINSLNVQYKELSTLQKAFTIQMPKVDKLTNAYEVAIDKALMQSQIDNAYRISTYEARVSTETAKQLATKFALPKELISPQAWSRFIKETILPAYQRILIPGAVYGASKTK